MQKRFFLFQTGLLLLFSTTIAPALSQSAPNQIQQDRIASSASAIRQGTQLFQAGKYGEAINAYFERGYAYYRNNNPDRAIADFSQVIQLNPQSADAYYFRGLNYTYKKPVDNLAANSDFSQAIKLDPTQARYYDARGKLQNDLKNYQGAIADYTKVIQLAPSANLYSDRGFALAALGKNNEALSDYTQAIRLTPKHSAAYYGRGLVRAKLGDKKGAMSDFQQAQRNY